MATKHSSLTGATGSLEASLENLEALGENIQVLFDTDFRTRVDVIMTL